MGCMTPFSSVSKTSALAAQVVTVAVAISTLAVAGAHPGFGAPVSRGHMHPATSVHLQPQLAVMSSDRTFNCQKPTATYNCYGPDQIRNAYGIQPLLNAGQDGGGKTITIVDAFQDPTLKTDVKQFDSAFDLPAPSLKVIAPFGLTPFDPTVPNQVGWSGEIALDVEWAHAIAPQAKIVLALSPSDADSDLINTETYVVQHSMGDVISMSFGEAEQCMAPALQQQEHSLYKTATSKGVTLLAGSGDYGAAQLTCDGSGLVQSASIPASDPNVTGVGGTELVADLKTGKYGSESVWNDPTFPGAGGGGFSSVYSRPDFQDTANTNAMRGVPDVAYSSGSLAGAIVAWGSSGSPGEFWVISGTSVGTPQWAAIVAIADQSAGRDLGNVNPALYKAARNGGQNSNFHDITVGNNGYPPISGYAAAPGWDAASGLGSPIANKLVKALADR